MKDGILKKYYESGEEGFKKFINFFETLSFLKKAELQKRVTLEDPVYMKWVKLNLLDFEQCFQLNNQDFKILVNETTNSLTYWSLAIHNTPLEKVFLDKVDHGVQVHYKEKLEMIKTFSNDQKFITRNKILDLYKSLQHKNIFEKRKWHIPLDLILSGSNTHFDKNGFRMNYEDGSPALRGDLNSVKQRTGDWKHYFENGTVFAEGKYVENKKEGPWIFRNFDDEIVEKGNFKNNTKIGKWEEANDLGEMKVVFYDKADK